MGYTDLGDSFEDMKLRAKDKQFNFLTYMMAKIPSCRRVWTTDDTTLFIFDKDRVLRYHGRIDDVEKPGGAKVHDTRAALDAMIAGKPVLLRRQRYSAALLNGRTKETLLPKNKRLDKEP